MSIIGLREMLSVNMGYPTPLAIGNKRHNCKEKYFQIIEYQIKVNEEKRKSLTTQIGKKLKMMPVT